MIVAAIGFLVFKGITSAIVFFKTANEAIAQRATLGNSTFQLEGMVMPGTVRTSGTARERRWLSSSKRAASRSP